MRVVLKKYAVEADKLRINVSITGGKGYTPMYELDIPKISLATSALLDEIRHELVVGTSIGTTEIFDPKEIDKLKEKFRQMAGTILTKKIPHLQEDTKRFLIGMLLHEMVGLGKLEFLMNDGDLEEIVINSAIEPVRVYHKNYGWLQTNIMIENEAKIQNYSNIIARRVGRQITTLNPLLDAHLVTGDRANAALCPIASKGNTITIRKFARDPWTMTDFIKNKTSTAQIFALIWLAMQYEMNILISGGTGSGKTSFLNVCMPFIPPNHRLISIEDTRELQLPEFLYWCPLTTREPNPEGKGAITMLDLLVNSLRMRPDRIILGEMRKKDQAGVLFEAMHTGHSVYATVHADSVHETIKRLVNPPIEVPSNLLSAVNLNVVMFRDRRRGIRRTYQIGEFIPAEEGKVIKPNIIYRWKPTTDTIIQHTASLRFFEDLSRQTGMSQSEITKDLRIRENILNWLVKNNIRDIHSVGGIMNQYYLDPDTIIKYVEGNLKPDKLLKSFE